MAPSNNPRSQTAAASGLHRSNTGAPSNNNSGYTSQPQTGAVPSMNRYQGNPSPQGQGQPSGKQQMLQQYQQHQYSPKQCLPQQQVAINQPSLDEQANSHSRDNSGSSLGSNFSLLPGGFSSTSISSQEQEQEHTSAGNNNREGGRKKSRNARRRANRRMQREWREQRAREAEEAEKALEVAIYHPVGGRQGTSDYHLPITHSPCLRELEDDIRNPLDIRNWVSDHWIPGNPHEYPNYGRRLMEALEEERSDVLPSPEERRAMFEEAKRELRSVSFAERRRFEGAAILGLAQLREVIDTLC